MSDDGSFEFVNQKTSVALEGGKSVQNFSKDGLKDAAGDQPKKWLGDIPPPSVLPSFLTTATASGATTNGFHPSPAIPQQPDSEQKVSSPATSKSADGGGLFDWVKDTVSNKGGLLLSKVAEKAKYSVDSVMTVLDPQMMRAFSSLEVIVCSEKDIEISPVREAFHYILGENVGIRGLDAESIEYSKQVVGFDEAYKMCGKKTKRMIEHYGIKGPVICVQNFVGQFQENKWYDLDLLILEDKEKSVSLQTLSHTVPVPYEVIEEALKEQEKKEIPVTVAHIMANKLQVHPSEWQLTVSGVPRRDRIYMAAVVLVTLYKNSLSKGHKPAAE